tara:strand:+ start:1693 stop:3153 length:1461 start_codon:yes stop_codon:yes gene_type:complete
MAIIFSGTGSTEVVIGGQVALTGSQKGVIGPFPRYNIDKQNVLVDNQLVGQTYNVSISGTALISGSSSMLVKGQRQISVMKIVRDGMLIPDLCYGKLDISPYGGSGEKITFNIAKLISVSTPEQTEDSAGVQYAEYTYTFECSRLTGDSFASASTISVKSITDSWQVSQNTEFGVDTAANVAANYFRTWTITRSLTVVASSTASTTMSYAAAKTMSESLLVDDPLSATENKDYAGKVIALGIPSTYTAFNHVRERTQDISEGSCSVTDTWVVGKYKATSSISFDITADEKAEFDICNASVTVQGYGEGDPDIASPTTTAYQNAVSLFATLKSTINTAAAAAFKAAGYSSLRATPTSVSRTDNQTDGTVSYNATYDNNSITFTGAIAESINITYSNEDGNNEIVAIIPVLAKSDGPVLQTFGTTNEKTINANLTLQMGRASRGSKPNGSNAMSNYVSPPTGALRRTKTEAWNPKNGQYNLTQEWVYI